MPSPAIVDIFQLVMGTLLKGFINTMSLPSALLYPVAFLTWQEKAEGLQELSSVCGAHLLSTAFSTVLGT